MSLGFVMQDSGKGKSIHGLFWGGGVCVNVYTVRKVLVALKVYSRRVVVCRC